MNYAGIHIEVWINNAGVGVIGPFWEIPDEEQWQKYKHMKSLIKQSVVGTTMMTAYSYLLSAATGDDYREPYLLAKMFHRLGVKPSQPIGWLAHFAVGTALAPVLRFAARRLKKQPITKALILGLGSGVIAVCAWRGLFAMHPHPPQNNRKAFYRQLVLAHIIFSLPFSMDHSPKPSLPQIPEEGKP